MKSFAEVNPEQLTINPFTLIGKDWLLIAAGKDGKTNAMTASWGGLGVLWSKPVAYIFVRDSRYTKEFIDGSDTFSLSVFQSPEYREMLGYMGSVSGRDEDKVEKMGLTVRMEGDTPWFDQAKMVMICKKLSMTPISDRDFLDDSLEKWYQDHDYHKMYVGEITRVLVEEQEE